eukprot:Ihof_evm1s1152 gene=Ihof_evmTU1s1152
MEFASTASKVLNIFTAQPKIHSYQCLPPPQSVLVLGLALEPPHCHLVFQVLPCCAADGDGRLSSLSFSSARPFPTWPGFDAT